MYSMLVHNTGVAAYGHIVIAGFFLSNPLPLNRGGAEDVWVCGRAGPRIVERQFILSPCAAVSLDERSKCSPKVSRKLFPLNRVP